MYYYEGHNPQTKELLRLPRTPLAEAIADGLMQHLATDNFYSHEGKMYGILLVELPTGEQRVLKAFSGLLNGDSEVEGWVPPIPGRDQVALEEACTLAKLEAIKQEIITLKQLPERQRYETVSGEFEQQLQTMSDRHRDCKHQRQEKRQQLCETLSGEALAIALEQLDEDSRQQGIERRKLKSQQNTILQPLQQLITAADGQISKLKQRRKILSQQLQTQMHAAYSLTNFLGQSLSLQQLMSGGLPTGTGDCCAPKLLHYAATHNLIPLTMAEFWWGASSANHDKIQGEFYGACVERCQPLMGFLLSGLPQHNYSQLPTPNSQLPIIYEDEWLIAVNKPPGLLSVPGRYSDRQDSVLSRLRHLLPDGMMLASVHRLDQETSGILLLARDRQIHRQLSRQFQQRQIHKVYEAVLAGVVKTNQGVIELPLWGDPQNRPYQQVDQERGKASVTKFRAMVVLYERLRQRAASPLGEDPPSMFAIEKAYTRVEFIPLTGRTHQLRVHAADPRGLGVTILGDRLYGCNAIASRLHLHARELSFEHPQLGETLHLHIKTPF
jgi:tRNA pseudouridine32 synthase / 23S rRNA pseudouridine746 synthase